MLSKYLCSPFLIHSKLVMHLFTYVPLSVTFRPLISLAFVVDLKLIPYFLHLILIVLGEHLKISEISLVVFCSITYNLLIIFLFNPFILL